MCPSINHKRVKIKKNDVHYKISIASENDNPKILPVLPTVVIDRSGLGTLEIPQIHSI